MKVHITCSNCGVWFYSKNEDEEYCSECKRIRINRASMFSYPKDGGSDLAQKMFEIVLEHKDKGGITALGINKKLVSKYGLSRKANYEVISVLDRSGYLVYMDGTRMFPYKNMHTGKVYENE